MKDPIRNLIFLTVLLFSISYDCFTSGVAYDKKYKLYPEIEASGCVIYFPFIYVYGKRWQRFGVVAFLLGTGSGFALILACQRRKPIIEKEISIWQENDNGNWRKRPGFYFERW